MRTLKIRSRERRALEATMEESGFWQGEQRFTHGFLLSPSVFTLSVNQQRQLEEIAAALNQCLVGLAKMAAVACDPHQGQTICWQMLGKIFRTGIPGFYHPLQVAYPEQTPAICKVDLLEDVEGHFWIAEIDGHNKHGLGYSVLARRLKMATSKLPNRDYQGVAPLLAEAVQTKGSRELTVIYANQERFYRPELLILADELGQLGIHLEVIDEIDWPKERQLPKVLLDFPEYFHNQWLRDALASAYFEGQVTFLIPPKPFLGSKAILAILRNDGMTGADSEVRRQSAVAKDEELEDILLSFLGEEAVETIRRYITPTYLVSKRLGRSKPRPETWENLAKSADYVLKGVMSSGMKQVYFPEDERYWEQLTQAAGTYYLRILQREVKQTTRVFGYWEGKEYHEAPFYSRLTLHAGQGRIADVIATSRQDKRTHGAKDCLQLGGYLQ